jgi:probable HAF family extracellular repeat protein
MYTVRFLNAPDATANGNYGTVATGINDSGKVVGYFCTSAIDPSKYYGFLEQQGQYYTIIIPNSLNNQAKAISGNGHISGSYDTFNDTYSYVFDSGNIQDVVYAGSMNLTAYGINDQQSLLTYNVGQDRGSYLYQNGNFHLISAPGAKPGYTYARGINNAGVIAGYYDGYDEVNGNDIVSFEDVAGSFTTFEVPGSVPYTAAAYGISNNGQVVGTFENLQLHNEGFIYANGQFGYFSVPGYSDTYLTGINAHGQLVGITINPHPGVDLWQSFVATPVPQPPTWMMMLIGSASLGLLTYRPRRSG